MLSIQAEIEDFDDNNNKHSRTGLNIKKLFTVVIYVITRHVV